MRATLHERYDRLLLDEFQDTDPIQIELAVRIAAADPDDPGAGSEPWEAVDVAPGHLFVVGDPKQSIYRFRRADIATFLRAAAPLRGRGWRGGASSRQLPDRRARSSSGSTTRSSALMGEPIDDAVPADVDSQPEYLALDATRAAPDAGPTVAILGRDEHPKGSVADDLRAAEVDRCGRRP